MPTLFLNGTRVPFHATRFVRPANQTPRTSSAGDRQSGFPSLPALPVNSLSPFHGDHNGE